MIPAIAVTAYASSRDRSASTAAAGYQAHVAKPFEPADVARALPVSHARRPDCEILLR